MLQMNFPRFRTLFKKWQFWVLLVTSLAIFIRSIPGWLNAAWGCDFGIYYGLTKAFVESKELFNPYFGWGGSYQYFPVLYSITGVVHWITGIDVLIIMPKIAPIFGGLSILVFYFIVKELVGDRKKAILSSLFLAVLPFHVYQTSHASPLTVGHFFLMLSIFLFLKFRQDSRYFVPLLASTVLLIMSHHLTTYFYLISLVFIIFFENAIRYEWTSTVRKDVVYILCASGLIFLYWVLVATPVFQAYMSNGFRIGSVWLSPVLIIVLFYFAFFLMFGVIWIKRKMNFFIEKEPLSGRAALFRFSLTIFICLVIMGIFTFVKLPWTNFRFTPVSIVYSVPLLVMFGFCTAGFRQMRFVPNGGFIKGWLLALMLSFVYGLVSLTTVFYPHRHLEYMMAAMSIIAVFGLELVFFNADFLKRVNISKKLQEIPLNIVQRRSGVLQKRQFLYIVVVLILVAANAVSVYPSHVALNASYEAITAEDIAVITWMDAYLDKNESVIASDHRLARMAEAMDFNSTLDEASLIWVGEEFTNYSLELYGIDKNYSKITHILIDDIMRDRVVHVGFGKIFYMTNESYEKFCAPPFELLYRNATYNENMEETHWAELYAVNWSFIVKGDVLHFGLS
jgi:hypothetical protein